MVQLMARMSLRVTHTHLNVNRNVSVESKCLFNFNEVILK